MLYTAHPGDPVYTCSDIVQEGSTVTCKCYSSNPGTPPAKFSWNGRNNDILYIYNVQREENGKTYTCSMTWGPNSYIRSQVVLTLTVLGDYILDFYTLILLYPLLFWFMVVVNFKVKGVL